MFDSLSRYSTVIWLKMGRKKVIWIGQKKNTFFSLHLLKITIKFTWRNYFNSCFFLIFSKFRFKFRKSSQITNFYFKYCFPFIFQAVGRTIWNKPLLLTSLALGWSWIIRRLVFFFQCFFYFSIKIWSWDYHKTQILLALWPQMGSEW